MDFGSAQRHVEESDEDSFDLHFFQSFGSLLLQDQHLLFEKVFPVIWFLSLPRFASSLSLCPSSIGLYGCKVKTEGFREPLQTWISACVHTSSRFGLRRMNCPQETPSPETIHSVCFVRLGNQLRLLLFCTDVCVGFHWMLSTCEKA